jgi:hypothetical protein
VEVYCITCLLFSVHLILFCSVLLGIYLTRYINVVNWKQLCSIVNKYLCVQHSVMDSWKSKQALIEGKVKRGNVL